MDNQAYWQRVQQIFDELVLLDSVEQHKRLCQLSAKNQQMIQEVKHLLRCYEQADDRFVPRSLPHWPS